MTSDLHYHKAMIDFRQARRKADIQEILSRFTGKSASLLSYDEVRQKLRAIEGSRKELREIPLDAIVGSVGRYTDFTRSFLPREEIAGERWARVMAITSDLEGLPPIDVYQVGEVYFVLDGNHRVSVARQMGNEHIQAYVTEVKSRVPLTADDSPDDLIVKAEYVAFLEQTQLDKLIPNVDLTVSTPGRYKMLLEHIVVHRHYMGIEQSRQIPFEEAIGHWYDTVFLPITDMIRQRGILRYFPGRTETDLYLWLSKYQAELQESLGWEIGSEAAADDLATKFSLGTMETLARAGAKFLDIVTPDPLESGPPPGVWRKEILTSHREDALFGDILVPITGDDIGWQALEQALVIAERENSRLLGLHIVGDSGETESDSVLAVQRYFNQRCQETNIPGELAISSGSISREICDRASFGDLLIINLAHPPSPSPIAKLSSGFRTIIRRCPIPILAVPRAATGLGCALLAYDGSPKSDEALYIGAYLSGKWNIHLTVVTVGSTKTSAEAVQASALEYLTNQSIQASYVTETGPISGAILNTADTENCEMIIMGGYGQSPVLEVVLGSVVDQVLRETQKPILICR